ncbi:GyrI-like domain-containing protein [uncultured Kordia sp.]|uniref:GyrI-like domain-containing protein n=1 Tax=uncultured Kordia sp. TaxID=507699 RepID=UPI0026136973|nr:GyrI-like domain-containing protein [uncultured Kordia sp.]
MTEPTIQTLPQKKLMGKSMRMSLVENTTPILWKSFMQNRKSVKNTVGTDLYSIQVYDDILYFRNFNPQTEFTKYAMTEVSSFDTIPEGMESLTIDAGLYAVFIYKGLPQDFSKMANYIFSQWLPNSEYMLDNRPHFEVLGNKYKPASEDSEEEVWIPIKNKRV